MKKTQAVSPSSKSSAVSDGKQILKPVDLSKYYTTIAVYMAALALVAVAFYSKVIFGIGFFWEDLMYQEFPHRVFAHDALIKFTFPHWNPYTFSGMPFFAAIHTGVLYITNIILSFLPLDHGSLWYALEFTIVLHVFIAGAAMFFLAREFSLSRLSSLIAAIAYMLCGFFVVHIIHSLMLYILAWLPLAMFLMKRGVERDKGSLFIFAGLLLGMTIFAGHPQVTFYEFLFLGAYSIYLVAYSSKHRITHSIFLLSMFVIAGGIGMIQLLPSAELGKESARVTWTFEMASEGSMSFRQLITFFIPKIFGGTNSPNPWHKEISFWLKDSYHSGYWTFWETTFYTGIAVLVFGLVQIMNVKRSKFALFCAIWFAFSLAVALGNHFPLYQFLYDYVPGFGRFRIPARILFTWDLLLPLMAARTIDELADPETRKRYLVPMSVLAGVGLLCGLAAVSGIFKSMWPEMIDQTINANVVKQGGIMLLMLFLGAGVTALVYRSIVNHRIYKLLIGGVIVLDLFVFGMDYHIVPYSVTQYFSREKQLADFLKKESAKELFRAKTRQGGILLLDRNQGMIDKIQLLEGYNPLNLFRHVVPGNDQRGLDLLNVKYMIAVDSLEGRISMAYNRTMLPRAKMFYKTIVAEDDSAVKRYLDAEFFDHHNVLLLTEKPSIALPESQYSTPVNNSVSVTKYDKNRIEIKVTTERNGLLWLSEIWYPAWKATVDGKPEKILPADYSFRAVAVPQGSHTVVMTFNSVPFRNGMILTLLILLASVGALIVLLRKEKKQLIGKP